MDRATLTKQQQHVSWLFRDFRIFFSPIWFSFQSQPQCWLGTLDSPHPPIKCWNYRNASLLLAIITLIIQRESWGRQARRLALDHTAVIFTCWSLFSVHSQPIVIVDRPFVLFETCPARLAKFCKPFDLFREELHCQFSLGFLLCAWQDLWGRENHKEERLLSSWAPCKVLGWHVLVHWPQLPDDGNRDQLWPNYESGKPALCPSFSSSLTTQRGKMDEILVKSFLPLPCGQGHRPMIFKGRFGGGLCHPLWMEWTPNKAEEKEN